MFFEAVQACGWRAWHGNASEDSRPVADAPSGEAMLFAALLKLKPRKLRATVELLAIVAKRRDRSELRAAQGDFDDAIHGLFRPAVSHPR